MRDLARAEDLHDKEEPVRRTAAAVRDATDVPSLLTRLGSALGVATIVAVRPRRRHVIADCAWRTDDWQAESGTVPGLSPSGLEEITAVRAAKMGAEAVGVVRSSWDAGRAANGRLVLGLAGVPRGSSLETATLATAVEVVFAHQQASAAAQSEAVLRERARIASAIHQGASQEIATITVQLEILDELLQRDPARAREFVSEIRETARQVLMGLRAALVDLTPTVPDSTWLVAGLRRLVENFADDWGVQLSFTFEGEARAIEAEALGLVFTFVTEGLTNLRKYSTGRCGSVHASLDRETMLVSVGDGGPASGQDVAEVPGHGLSILWGRAHLLGGDLRIEPQTDGGTRVILELPV